MPGVIDVSQEAFAVLKHSPGHGTSQNLLPPACRQMKRAGPAAALWAARATFYLKKLLPEKT